MSDDDRNERAMGCGQTLFLGKGGHVTCSLIGCPNPVAVDDLLHVAEVEHIVEIREADFRIVHPLRERVESDPFDMFGCDLHTWLSGLEGPPRKPGRYLATPTDGGWDFTETASA
jgi:hypothetical protein